jgi:hypothetical protein
MGAFSAIASVNFGIRPEEKNSLDSFTNSIILVHETEESASIRLRRRSRDFAFHRNTVDDNSSDRIADMDTRYTIYHCGRICLRGPGSVLFLA